MRLLKQGSKKFKWNRRLLPRVNGERRVGKLVSLERKQNQNALCKIWKVRGRETEQCIGVNRARTWIKGN